MKKLLALSLALCLLLPALALAEAAPTEYDPIDMGDFSMAIPEDMDFALSEQGKANNAVWFILYPAYNATGDSSTNFNVVWNEAQTDMSVLPDETREYLKGEEYKEYLAEACRQQGFELLSYEVISVELTQLDGLDALANFSMTTLDMSALGEEYAGLQVSLYQYQLGVSGDFGTYHFTGTASTQELMDEYILPLFDAITWN